MRSLRPVLRTSRILQLRSTSLHLQTPRPSILSPRNSTNRCYSEQRQQSKPEEEQPQQQGKEEGKHGQEGEKEDPKKHYREDTSPPPDPNKSPFQVFVDTLKTELAKNKEFQESVKALQDESGKIGDSEALRRAKEAYSKARVSTAFELSVNIRNNRIGRRVLRGRLLRRRRAR
jgi:mitochondrial import inner membrane translocase subunit TIM44